MGLSACIMINLTTSTTLANRFEMKKMIALLFVAAAVSGCQVAPYSDSSPGMQNTIRDQMNQGDCMGMPCNYGNQ
jgi:hypothetical protein